MKAGFYSPYLDTFGGGERYILTLASQLSKRESVQIFWDDPTIKAPLSKFLKIDLSKVQFTKNIFNHKKMTKALSTRNYDLIFVLSDGSVPLTFGKLNILHFQVPFNFNQVSKLTTLKLKRYKHVVVNSHFTKKFIDRCFKVDSLVIYPPVDVDKLRPGKKEKIILSVGRFGPNQLHPKKQEEIIEVFKEFYKKNKDWKLYLVGQAKKDDQKYLRGLKKTASGFAIRIFENLSSQELIDVYAKSSIYWHATGFGEDELRSPQKMEHFGISTVEASAAGAVPVVIDKGGQKEIVSDGKSGFLWSTKSQLLHFTQELADNKKMMTDLSVNAIKNSRKFSKDIFLKKYEALIYKH